MARGGKREGSGGRPSWKNGKTKPVRVPVALAEKILEIARVLDEEGSGEGVTESKVIDLTGIAIYSSKDGPTVRLIDLVRAGYEIQPDRLVRSLKTQTNKVTFLNEIDEILGAQNE
jgi:hypothetical protein